MSGAAAAERRDVETLEGLFQPDILAPAQYFEGFKKEQARAPERDLALAMLEDAVVCFQKYVQSTREKERRIFADAAEWFLSDDRKWVFSFLNVCEFLGLDPEFVRKGLLRWKEAALNGQPGKTSEWTAAGKSTSGAIHPVQAEKPNRRRRHSRAPRPEDPKRRAGGGRTIARAGQKKRRV